MIHTNSYLSSCVYIPLTLISVTPKCRLNSFSVISSGLVVIISSLYPFFKPESIRLTITFAINRFINVASELSNVLNGSLTLKIRIEPKKYNNDNDNQVLLDWDANLAKLSVYIIKYGYNYKLFAPKGRVKSFRNRLTDKLFPSNKITNEAIFEYTKGGFFENFFKTTSQEYKNFKSAFLDFQDPENKNFGNLDNLEKATKAYLHHKIPAFKTTDHLPKLEDIENLSGTSKKRALLCFGVLETIYRQREIDKMENTFKDAEIDIQQDVIVDEQDKFQKDLDLKIDDSKINDNIINNEIQNDLENDKTM